MSGNGAVRRRDVTYRENERSVYCTITRRVGDNLWFRVQENLLPNMTQSGAVHEMDGTRVRYFGRNTFFRWCLPVDDCNTRVVAWSCFGDRADPVRYNNPADIERLEQGEIFDRPDEERQRNPGDYEAMVSLGPIVVHGKEHLRLLRCNDFRRRVLRMAPVLSRHQAAGSVSGTEFMRCREIGGGIRGQRKRFAEQHAQNLGVESRQMGQDENGGVRLFNGLQSTAWGKEYSDTQPSCVFSTSS